MARQPVAVGQHRVRLAEVAARAVTSSPIASRIINDDPTLRVRPELRRRVLRAARELGYRPNELASALRRGRTGALAFVVPTLTNPTFARILRRAVVEARESGYAVLLVEDSDEAPDDSVLQLVSSGRIDGLLIASARPGIQLLAKLRTLEIPHVFVNRGVDGSGRNVVMRDADASQRAVEHLAALGHRRIAHFAAPLALDPARRRVAGTLAAAARLGLPEPVVMAQERLEDGGDALATARRLTHAHPEITAVYADSPMLAAAVLRALNEQGRAVPHDCSVMAYTDTPMAALCTPPLTVVEMPLEALGSAAVLSLVRQLEGHPPADLVVHLAPLVLQRSSTAAAPVAPAVPRTRNR